MLERNYFSHGSLRSRLLGFGAEGRIFGENLAWSAGQASHARGVVARWLASAGHRRNVLHPSYSRVGVGVALGRFSGWERVSIVTADFAGG